MASRQDGNNPQTPVGDPRKNPQKNLPESEFINQSVELNVTVATIIKKKSDNFQMISNNGTDDLLGDYLIDIRIGLVIVGIRVNELTFLLSMKLASCNSYWRRRWGGGEGEEEQNATYRFVSM